MTKLLLLFSICFLYVTNVTAQEEPNTGTKKIKIEKELPFVKAAFNEAEYKVVAFDKFGNPHMEAITSFVIQYIENKKVYQAPVKGNVFPEKTIQFFTKKRTLATKVCLINIVAADENAHSQSLPDLCDIVLFPDCKRK